MRMSRGRPCQRTQATHNRSRTVAASRGAPPIRNAAAQYVETRCDWRGSFRSPSAGRRLRGRVCPMTHGGSCTTSCTPCRRPPCASEHFLRSLPLAHPTHASKTPILRIDDVDGRAVFVGHLCASSGQTSRRGLWQRVFGCGGPRILLMYPHQHQQKAPLASWDGVCKPSSLLTSQPFPCDLGCD